MKIKIGNRTVKVKKVKRVIKGCIIRDMEGQYVFRVYKDDDKFTDYDIHHRDLDVKILKSSDAALYDDGKKQWLDYSPDTLGMDTTKKREE
jgi:hypothetical protein